MENETNYNETADPVEDPWEGRDVLSYNPKENVSFRYAELTSADFSGCNLSGVDFSYAKLCNANFKNAILVGTIFSYADLTSASFDEAKFS